MTFASGTVTPRGARPLRTPSASGLALVAGSLALLLACSPQEPAPMKPGPGAVAPSPVAEKPAAAPDQAPNQAPKGPKAAKGGKAAGPAKKGAKTPDDTIRFYPRRVGTVGKKTPAMVGALDSKFKNRKARAARDPMGPSEVVQIMDGDDVLLRIFEDPKTHAVGRVYSDSPQAVSPVGLRPGHRLDTHPDFDKVTCDKAGPPFDGMAACKVSSEATVSFLVATDGPRNTHKRGLKDESIVGLLWTAPN